MSGSYSYVGADGLTYQVGQSKFVLLLYRGGMIVLYRCAQLALLIENRIYIREEFKESLGMNFQTLSA